MQKKIVFSARVPLPVGRFFRRAGGKQPVIGQTAEPAVHPKTLRL